MIDLTVPVGQQPQDLVAEVRIAIFDHQVDTRDNPPKLQPAIERARQSQEMDDLAGLDSALLDVAVAAWASLVRLRAAGVTS